MIMVLIYLVFAPKGSSPGLFYFPSLYLQLYPGRDRYVVKREIETVIVDDKGEGVEGGEGEERVERVEEEEEEEEIIIEVLPKKYDNIL